MLFKKKKIYKFSKYLNKNQFFFFYFTKILCFQKFSKYLNKNQIFLNKIKQIEFILYKIISENNKNYKI